MLSKIKQNTRRVECSYRGLLYLVAFCMLLSGCGVARLDDAAWQDKRYDIVWPQAPEVPRVRFLKEIRGAQDVGISSKGVVKKVFEFVSGHKEEFLDFFTPQCIAADGTGLFYVADPSVGIVHKYNLATKEVTYITTARDKRLGSPVGVALDSDGNVYVSDSQLATVFKFAADGEFIRELDGNGKLKRPAGIAVAKNGDKYVADIVAGTVHVFGKNDVLKDTLPRADFTETLNRPTYVAIDNQGFLYVTDTMNFTVRVFDSSGAYVRNIGQIGDVPGSFARPKGVALDSDRNIYVIDSIFGNFQIFNQEGQLLLYVGQEGELPGEMILPAGIYIDENDRIYVSDTFNHRIQIYQYVKEKVTK